MVVSRAVLARLGPALRMEGVVFRGKRVSPFKGFPGLTEH